MPVLKLCATPGCNRRVRSGKCAEHKRLESRSKDARRRELGAKSSDPYWQRMRLRVLERDGFMCTCRGCTLHEGPCYSERDLTVDHIDHVRATSTSQLRTLCRPCNSARH